MIDKYQTKIKMIDALRWDGNEQELINFIGIKDIDWTYINYPKSKDVIISCPNLINAENNKVCRLNDYIKKDDLNQIEIVTGWIFEDKYELI